ncbi:MAG: DNA alkylation repair protein [Candidatus Bruticola sp.]
MSTSDSDNTIYDSLSFRAEMEKMHNPLQAEQLQRFFKTGVGQYGWGDIFWGIRVPEIRALVKKSCLSPVDSTYLVKDKIHEVRLAGLLLWQKSFVKAGKTSSLSLEIQQEIIDLYLKHTKYINNWDLVDLSASILGTWLLDKDRHLLYQLSASENMWEQRIAVVASHVFIKNGQFEDTLSLCRLYFHSRFDLIHKACGWMLREIGKRDQAVLEAFLQEHRLDLPRTALRYAVERLDRDKRAYFMRK